MPAITAKMSSTKAYAPNKVINTSSVTPGHMIVRMPKMTAKTPRRAKTRQFRASAASILVLLPTYSTDSIVRRQP
jgi:hypothetical protein